jgi:putative transposase
MIYNPDIHHRHSIRLRDFDYAGNGAYFVTICVQGRECLFGEIADCEIRLNDSGRMVESWWRESSNKFPSFEIDSFVVMPNHFHGIVLLNNRRGESCIRPSKEGDHEDQGDHEDRPYGTHADSLGRIFQAFKSMTTVEYVRGVERFGWPQFPGRLWQRNYYERIIRNEAELNVLREYIAENPMKWAEDKENPTFIP